MRRTLHALAIALLALSSAGCVGLLANLIHAGTGHKVPARFSGLAEKRVAVICVSNPSGHGPTALTSQLSREIGRLLAVNIKKLSLVPPQEIEDWIDSHDWDQLDYAALGRGVGAQMLVAVDLNSFSVHEGPTLYKGRADVEIVVYDMEQNAKVVYEAMPPQIQFPTQTTYSSTDMTERDFRQKFVKILAERIARHFYPYELRDEFAQDAILVGN